MRWTSCTVEEIKRENMRFFGWEEHYEQLKKWKT